MIDALFSTKEWSTKFWTCKSTLKNPFFSHGSSNSKGVNPNLMLKVETIAEKTVTKLKINDDKYTPSKPECL